jgi:hypothetical protein
VTINFSRLSNEKKLIIYSTCTFKAVKVQVISHHLSVPMYVGLDEYVSNRSSSGEAVGD